MTEKLSLMEKTLIGIGGASFLAWSILPSAPLQNSHPNASFIDYCSLSAAGITCLSAIGFYLSRISADIGACRQFIDYSFLDNELNSDKNN